MKMNGEVLVDLIIHSFLKGVDCGDNLGVQKEGPSDIEDVLEEYWLFRPADDKDGGWDYNDQA